MITARLQSDPVERIFPVQTTESDFMCVSDLDWGFNFATKITVNIFLTTNRMSRDIVCKERITGFKKCQRME